MANRTLLLGVFVFVAIGCRNSPPPPIDTGSREVISRYFDAIAKKDWAVAYSHIHADSRNRWNQAAFDTRANSYRKRLGISPEKVVIRSCDEQGEQAIAHLYLGDAKGSARHRVREGVVLKREDENWKIVLPDNFGELR